MQAVAMLFRGRAAERVRRRPTLIVAAQGSSIGQPLRVGTPPCGPAPRQARAPAALTRGRAAPHELYRFPLPSQHLPPLVARRRLPDNAECSLSLQSVLLAFFAMAATLRPGDKERCVDRASRRV